MQPATKKYLPIFAGIDGTGDPDDTEYARAFSGSHVKTLSGLPWTGGCFYRRGPTQLGIQTEGIAEQVAIDVALAWRRVLGRGAFPRVFLAGFRRGGAAAILACRLLRKEGINVAYLALFDAVDRTVGMEASTIAANVQVCQHAARHPDAKSRPEFGSCGTRCEDQAATRFAFRNDFMCTHGGVGGTPWTRSNPRLQMSDEGYIIEPRSARKAAALAVGGSIGAALTIFGVPVRPAAIADSVSTIASTRVTPEMDAQGAELVERWIKPRFLSAMLHQP